MGKFDWITDSRLRRMAELQDQRLCTRCGKEPLHTLKPGKIHKTLGAKCRAKDLARDKASYEASKKEKQRREKLMEGRA